jgi:hypothetical protein
MRRRPPAQSILLLPALSSISTRHEMRPLQERLAREYSTFSIDWPGFGDEARPQIDVCPWHRHQYACPPARLAMLDPGYSGCIMLD